MYLYYAVHIIMHFDCLLSSSASSFDRFLTGPCSSNFFEFYIGLFSKWKFTLLVLPPSVKKILWPPIRRSCAISFSSSSSSSSYSLYVSSSWFPFLEEQDDLLSLLLSNRSGFWPLLSEFKPPWFICLRSAWMYFSLTVCFYFCVGGS